MSKTSAKQKIEVLQGWLLQINRGKKTKPKVYRSVED
jgi:hypothetical protein